MVADCFVGVRAEDILEEEKLPEHQMVSDNTECLQGGGV